MSRADDMDRQIDEWAAKFAQKAEKYRALTRDMESITGQAESASGAVRVTVNRAGILTDLQITDDIRSMRGSQLAGEIMSAVRAAQAGLGRQVVAMMEEKVPEDQASIANVADNYERQFPQQADEDETQAARETPESAPDEDDDGERNTSVFD